MIEDDEAFVEAARKYIGVSWVHQGRSRNGLDCVGLVVLSARACGLDVPLLANYGRLPNFPRVKRELMRFGYRVGAISIGTVVIYNASHAVHMAIASENGNVIQALSTVGRVTESPINFIASQYWQFKWHS